MANKWIKVSFERGIYLVVLDEYDASTVLTMYYSKEEDGKIKVFGADNEYEPISQKRVFDKDDAEKARLYCIEGINRAARHIARDRRDFKQYLKVLPLEDKVSQTNK